MLASWQVPAGWGTVGARVAIVVNRSGPLEVIPSGEILSVENMQAGSDASGRTKVRNLTSGTVTLDVRLSESTGELDHMLDLEIAIDGNVILRGPIGTLRHSSARHITLRPNQTIAVDMRASLRPHIGDAYRGRVVVGELDLRVSRPT